VRVIPPATCARAPAHCRELKASAGTRWKVTWCHNGRAGSLAVCWWADLPLLGVGEPVLLAGVAPRGEGVRATAGSECRYRELMSFHLFSFYGASFSSPVFPGRYWLFHDIPVTVTWYCRCLALDTCAYTRGVVVYRTFRQTSGPVRDPFKSDTTPSAPSSLLSFSAYRLFLRIFAINFFLELFFPLCIMKALKSNRGN